MHEAFFTYRSSQLHYCWFGAGDHILLCLHGYGESERSFRFLEKHLPAGYKAIAIDFPFHGQTRWREGLQFTLADLLFIVQALCAEHGGETSRITLMGYSMGGRVALQIFQCIPQQIDNIILLAPDGLKVNFWYWLATQTFLGNRLFAFTMKHPTWLFWLLQLGNKMKLINQSVAKFTRYYIHDVKARRELFERWTCMRHIRPHPGAIKKLVRRYKTPVRLLYGRFDRIIRHERGEKFRTGIESFCRLHIIETGHQVLQEKHAGDITGLLQP